MIKDIILVSIILIIIAGAILYIVKQKKSGAKCIGCPYAKTCGKDGCSCNNDNPN